MVLVPVSDSNHDNPLPQHLGGVSLPPDGYDDMICDGCMTSHEFLRPYSMTCQHPVRMEGRGEVSDDTVTVVDEGGCKDTNDDGNSSGGCHGDDGSGGCHGDGGSGQCELVRRREIGAGGGGDGAGYFPPSWRTSLCKCDSCMVGENRG